MAPGVVRRYSASSAVLRRSSTNISFHVIWSPQMRLLVKDTPYLPVSDPLLSPSRSVGFRDRVSCQHQIGPGDPECPTESEMAHLVGFSIAKRRREIFSDGPLDGPGTESHATMGAVASIEKLGVGRYHVRYRTVEARQRARTSRRKIDARQFRTEVERAHHHGDLIDPRRARITFGTW